MNVSFHKNSASIENFGEKILIWNFWLFCDFYSIIAKRSTRYFISVNRSIIQPIQSFEVKTVLGVFFEGARFQHQICPENIRTSVNLGLPRDGFRLIFPPNMRPSIRGSSLVLRIACIPPRGSTRRYPNAPDRVAIHPVVVAAGTRRPSPVFAGSRVVKVLISSRKSGVLCCFCLLLVIVAWRLSVCPVYSLLFLAAVGCGLLLLPMWQLSLLWLS